MTARMASVHSCVHLVDVQAKCVSHAEPCYFRANKCNECTACCRHNTGSVTTADVQGRMSHVRVKSRSETAQDVLWWTW